MNERAKQILHWSPRILGILYALFISLFALDVWEMEGSFWWKLAGFGVHLIPSFLLLAAVVIGWRWNWLGGVLFLGLTALFTLYFGWWGEWEVLLPMAGTMAFIGLLFLADWWLTDKPQLRPRY